MLKSPKLRFQKTLLESISASAHQRSRGKEQRKGERQREGAKPSDCTWTRPEKERRVWKQNQRTPLFFSLLPFSPSEHKQRAFFFRVPQLCRHIRVVERQVSAIGFRARESGGRENVKREGEPRAGGFPSERKEARVERSIRWPAFLRRPPKRGNAFLFSAVRFFSLFSPLERIELRSAYEHCNAIGVDSRRDKGRVCSWSEKKAIAGGRRTTPSPKKKQLTGEKKQRKTTRFHKLDAPPSKALTRWPPRCWRCPWTVRIEIGIRVGERQQGEEEETFNKKLATPQVASIRSLSLSVSLAPF